MSYPTVKLVGPRFLAQTPVAVLSAWSVLGTVAGCGGQVEVGAAKANVTAVDGGDTKDNQSGDAGVDTKEDDQEMTDLTTGGSTSSEPETDAGGGFDCDASLSWIRESYLEWQSTPNDFGDLAGSVFLGYVVGGDDDLVLTINADQSASLVVGEPATPPTDPDEGYLCRGPVVTPSRDDGVDCSGLVSGATYVIYGASLDSNRLRVPLDKNSPFDDWCALQDPVPFTDDCGYDTIGNEGFSYGEECFVGSRSVDCRWLELAQFVRPCMCDADACMSQAGQGSTYSLDLRYLGDSDELQGSLVFDNDETREVYFARKTD